MVEDKLTRILREKQHATILMVSPTVMKMPMVVKRYDDPFLPFGQLVIRATRDLVSGAIALERTIAYAGTEVLNILHGPFAHPTFIDIIDDTAFNADGLTVTSDSQFVSPRADRKIFTIGEGHLVSGDIKIAIAGDDVLYAGFDDEYETKLRQAIERFNGAD